MTGNCLRKKTTKRDLSEPVSYSTVAIPTAPTEKGLSNVRGALHRLCRYVRASGYRWRPWLPQGGCGAFDMNEVAIVVDPSFRAYAGGSSAVNTLSSRELSPLPSSFTKCLDSARSWRSVTWRFFAILPRTRLTLPDPSWHQQHLYRILLAAWKFWSICQQRGHQIPISFYFTATTSLELT
jgi:hypothetical protein